MYILVVTAVRVSVSLFLAAFPHYRYPTILHGPGCKLNSGEWYGVRVPSSYAIVMLMQN